MVIPENSNHPQEIINGVKRFSDESKKKFEFISDVKDIILQAGVLFIFTHEEELAIVMKKIRKSDFNLGHEIGTLSFNETILKELLDISVITTDFEAMGKSAAEMILNNINGIQFNSFQLIKRHSF